jgi:hypothetical protein
MEEYSSQVVAYEYTEIASLSGNREYTISRHEESHGQAGEFLPVWVHLLYFTLFVLGSSLICYLAWDKF